MAANNTKQQVKQAEPVAKEPVKKEVKIRMKRTYCGTYGLYYYNDVYVVSGEIASIFIKNDDAEEVKE